MKSGRIPCIVPFCRCTADASKHPPGTEIICQKHWRMVPAHTKARYRQVKRRYQKVWRMTHDPKKVRQPGGAVIYRTQDEVQRCWARIKREAIERAAGI